MSEDLAVVSHEQDGRILSGVGASVEDLQATMERHAPKAPAANDAEKPGAGAVAADVPADAAPASSTEPPQTRGRQRFADLTRERDAARTETASERTKREAAEQRIAALEAQLRQATTPAQQQQAQQALNTEVQRQEQQQPQKFSFPKYEDFIQQPGNEGVSYDDWQDLKDEARYNWRRQQEAPVEQVVGRVLNQTQQEQQFLATHQQTLQRGRAAYKDFDALRSSGPGATIPLGYDHASSQARAVYVINHPQSEHLQYAIFKDASLAQSMQRMSDFDFAAALMKLAPNGSSASPASLPASGAVTPPAPYQPVGSGSSTTVPSAADVIARGGHDYDKSGWRERRARELGRNGRR